jgi:hypothetical protein
VAWQNSMGEIMKAKTEIVAALRAYKTLDYQFIPFTAEEAADLIELQAREIEDLQRAAQRSDEFRANQTNRQWETSYTKRVVDALLADWDAEAPQDLEPPERAAAELLIDYHKTQHVVYNQRDQARRERDEALDRIESWRNVAAKFGRRLGAIRAGLNS